MKAEAEQSKLTKTSQAFVKFFVPKKSDAKPGDSENIEKTNTEQTQAFMSFQVKDDMKIAPLTRRSFNSQLKYNLEQQMSKNADSSQLYLAQLKNNAIVPKKSCRTWLDDDNEKSVDSDDLFVIGNCNLIKHNNKSKRLVLTFLFFFFSK